MIDGNPKRILYLENQRDSARILTNILYEEGYDVVVCDTAPSDIARLIDASYDLILLNPHMPAADGANLIDALLSLPAAPPLLLVTQLPDINIARRAVQIGVENYLFQGAIEEHAQLLPTIIRKIWQERPTQTTHEATLNNLRQDNRNLTLLTRIAQLLTSTLNMDRVILQLVQTITEIVVTEGSSVWLWDREKAGYLKCVAMYLDGNDITASALPMPPGAGIVGWVAAHGKPVNVHRTGGDARFSAAIDDQTGYQTNSILAVPLISGSEVIGVLELVNKAAGHFNERDQEMAATVAVYAANAIENARLVASISQQRDQLEKQNEALDAFAYSVAHDLKNPLTLVVGYADMLRDDHETLAQETMVAGLDTIVQYGVKMSNIVDALLLLARVGGDSEIETEIVEMGDVVDAVLQRMQPMIQSYAAAVTAPAVWPHIVGYGSWLEEVWFNYLSNAIKYGGRPPVLLLGYDAPADGFVRFWVQDNGPGLSLPDPFILFSRDARGRRNHADPDSHGLGLSIVLRIVDRLGGKVGVESAPGRGSCFSFTLPVDAATTSTE